MCVDIPVKREESGTDQWGEVDKVSFEKIGSHV